MLQGKKHQLSQLIRVPFYESEAKPKWTSHDASQLEQLAKRWSSKGETVEGRRDIMARDFGLSLRLADLGREDSSAGETE